MQVARISMGEYKSVDALDQFIEDYSKGFWELFPNATSASTVRTGPTSIINTTIYPDEDSAKEGLEKRTEWLKGYSYAITDTFFYEGVRQLKNADIVNFENLNFFSKFISKLSENNPLLYGSMAILTALVLGVIGAGGRQLLSKYKNKILIKKI